MKEWFLDIFNESLPLLFAIFLASIGGAVHYLNKINKQGLPFRLVNFCLEIFTSGFVGIIAFMLCDAANWGWQATAAISAISGHMGVRALFLMEQLIVLPILTKQGYNNENTDSKRKTH